MLTNVTGPKLVHIESLSLSGLTFFLHVLVTFCDSYFISSCR